MEDEMIKSLVESYFNDEKWIKGLIEDLEKREFGITMNLVMAFYGNFPEKYAAHTWLNANRPDLLEYLQEVESML